MPSLMQPVLFVAFSDSIPSGGPVGAFVSKIYDPDTTLDGAVMVRLHVLAADGVEVMDPVPFVEDDDEPPFGAGYCTPLPS